MNKLLFIAAVSCFTILTAGCTSDSVDIKENEKEEIAAENDSQVQTPESPSPPAETDEPQSSSESSYVIEKASYQTENLMIHYPQFQQLHDKEKEESINQWIKDEALSYIQQYQEPDVTAAMDYQILMQTPETVSIVYTGETSIEGGAYLTHLLFTTNVDITTGEKVKLLEPYTVNEALVEALKKGTYLDRENPSQPNQEKAAAVFDYINSLQNQEWIDALKQADNPNAEENIWGVFTYQTPDGLVVSFQVPHALGDHAEILLAHTTIQ